MKKRISKIKILPITGVTNLELIDRQLKALILTAEGTLPGSRGFGLPAESLDATPNEAINLFTMELSEKVDEFIPVIAVSGIEADGNEKGELTVQVFVEGRD